MLFRSIIHANMAILEKMNPYFHGKKEGDVGISGNVMIGNNTIIKGETTLIGPIIIGNNCIIEPHTKIGPNVSVGDNSRLSECAVNNSIIMNDCVVEGKINITKSIIAANSNISFLAESKKDKVFLLGEGTRITL